MDSKLAPPPSLAGRIKCQVFLAYAVLVVVFALRIWGAPEWGWDVLGYAGSLQEMGGGSPAEIHRMVYAELDAVAPTEVAQELRHSIPYREQLSNDPEAFFAQLPFYRGRVVFLGLLALLNNVGLPPLGGAFLISLLAGIAFALSLPLALMRFLPPTVAVLAAILIMTLGGGISLASMGTPDMLATALLFAGAWALFECRPWWLAVGLLLLALGTRSDHILLVAPLLLWSHLCTGNGGTRLGRGPFLISLALCAGVFWFCTAGRDTYGWWTVFHHTFIEYMAFPAVQVPEVDFASAAKRSLQSLPMFKATEPLLFSLIAVASIAIGWRRDKLKSRGACLTAIAFAAMLAHFALFPALWPRLMLPYWTLTLMGLAIVLVEERRRLPATSDHYC